MRMAAGKGTVQKLFLWQPGIASRLYDRPLVTLIQTIKSIGEKNAKKGR